MAKINWRLIAFVSALWWFIYAAPTEGFFLSMVFPHAGHASAHEDDF